MEQKRENEIVPRGNDDERLVEIENARGVYCRSFPFFQIQDKTQFYWADAVESTFFLRDFGVSSGLEAKFHHFDDLLMSFRVLEETFKIKPSQSTFLDCLGNGGISCLLAVCFRYKKCMSIELTEENLVLGRNLLTELRNNNIVQGSTVKFKLGSFLDYFDFESDVVFFNACESTPSLGFDEGYLTSLFLKMSNNLLPGTLLVIFTNFLSLETEDCMKMGFNYFTCRYKRKKDPRDSKLNTWILQKH